MIVAARAAHSSPGVDAGEPECKASKPRPSVATTSNSTISNRVATRWNGGTASFEADERVAIRVLSIHNQATTGSARQMTL